MLTVWLKGFADVIAVMGTFYKVLQHLGHTSGPDEVANDISHCVPVNLFQFVKFANPKHLNHTQVMA